MKFTLSWLKEHLETDASLQEILDTLTVIGLEVEEVNNPAETLKDFIVAKVVSAEKHPDADKLKLCKVDTGKETLQVVCGAPNAREGINVVFAPIGTYVPGIDFTLTKAKIRGVESSGMMCSGKELEISDDHEGIIELDTKAKPGTSFVEDQKLDDPVIEIAITPNRPDCLGVYGIARDLAAAGLGKLKDEPVTAPKGSFDCPVEIDLKFDKKDAYICPVFAGRYVKDLKNGPSPEWMQKRLRAIGLRPINALVDVTNYISFDRGRPLHVYDADKLKGTLHARLGKSGEKFAALDNNEYDVDDTMCVIADDNGVLGLGGIIGGETTGCTEETTNVLIESAYFDPITTAMTGRKAGINSDARFRFERGIDTRSAKSGVDHATKLILEICGGKSSKTSIAGKAPEKDVEINFNIKEVERLTGVALETKDIKKTLQKLGFEIDGKGDQIEVEVPSWRPDINQSADLVEEVIRLYGVDNIPAVPLPRLVGVARPTLTPLQLRARRTRRVLASRGLTEAVTWSFLPRELASLFGGGQDELELANPISVEMSSMRPTLLPGLLTAAQRNSDRGFPDSALFEMGQAYRGDQREDQYSGAAGIRTGTSGLSGSGRHWDGAAQPISLFDAKADAFAVLQSIGQDPNKVQVTRDAPAWFHPGRSGAIRLGPKILLGVFGELHPSILKALDLNTSVVGFELFLNAIPQPKRKSTSKSALESTDLQTVTRDFAFIMDRDIPAGDVVRAALGSEKKLISNVNVFDIYEGKGVEDGKKSIAIEITLMPKDKTLTEKEIEAVADKVIKQVKKSTGGEIRG